MYNGMHWNSDISGCSEQGCCTQGGTCCAIEEIKVIL